MAGRARPRTRVVLRLRRRGAAHAGLAAALNAVQCCLFPLLYPAAEERKALLLTYLEPLIQGVSVANLGFLTADHGGLVGTRATHDALAQAMKSYTRV